MVIAYDGSLQAARELAAFEATGLGDSGQVHIVSVDSSAADAKDHAEIARQFLSYHKIEAAIVALKSSDAAGKRDSGSGQPHGCRPAGDGCVRRAELTQFFIGSSPNDPRAKPGAVVLVPLNLQPGL